MYAQVALLSFYRSISPNTTSNVPMMATISAIMWLRPMWSMRAKWAKPGALILHLKFGEISVRKIGGTKYPPKKSSPVGSAWSVSHEVDTELSLWSFDAGVGGASWYCESLGVQLEVVDQSLHWRLEKKSKHFSTIQIKGVLWCRTFISARLGGTHLASSVCTSPSGMSFKHWYMMRSDSLISLMRIKYLERELKVTIWDDDPNTPCVPVVAIAIPSDGHVEVDKVIGVVGLGLS